MKQHPDVSVIGGGIIGLTCAYLLAKEGFAVEVLDRGELGQEASWAGAGIIPPGNSSHAATPLDRLRAIGSEQFPTLSNELRELTGIDNGYLRCGGIEFLDAGDREALNLWANEGIVFERLTLSTLRDCEPSIGDAPAEAFLLPDCAQVRNPRHLKALIAACKRLGVRLSPHTPVTDFRADEVGRVLIAAGAWSQVLLARSGGIPVQPVRGQIVLLRTPTPLISRVLMFGKHYLVPRSDGRLLVGSTEEPEAQFEKANTPRAVAELTAFATRLVPALSSAEWERCWSGIRPGTTDGLPLIGPVPGMDNIYVATGHFRAGVQLSIGTAQVITELFTGRSTCVPLTAFAVNRKPAHVVKAAFRS